MTQAPGWQFEEMKFTGVGCSVIEEVAAYDNMHEKLRNYAEATGKIIRLMS